MRTVAEVAKELRDREQDYLPELEKLRIAYPSLADHKLLVLMYLELKDKNESRVQP